MEVRDKTKWYGVVSGGAFIAISTYLRVKWIFDSGKVAGTLYLIAIVTALLTLVLGLLSLPRWQSFFALAVFGYAVYWFSKPAYVLP
jgi:hypothetical protein